MASFLLRAVLFVAPLIMCEGAITTTSNIKRKDFVDVLKHKLRKNNDDYIETLLKISTTKETNKHLIEQIKLEFKKGPAEFIKGLASQQDGYRRSLNELAQGDNGDLQKETSPTEQDATTTNTDLTNATFDKTPLNNIELTAADVLTPKTVNRPNFRSKSKLGNKDKMDKFKMFMSKNKNALNDFLNKKMLVLSSQHPGITPSLAMSRMQPMPRADPTQGRITPRVQAADRKQDLTPSTILGKLMKVTPTLPETTKPSKETGGARLRARLEHGEFEENSTPPPGEDLDMAPAKGAKVHVLRLKKRLCHRNVMLPEGPKYDSKGNMYLGPYVNKYGRDYASTRRPKLLLPRCCNCCKKSVLGCQ